MKKIVIFIILLVFATANLSAQDLRKKAEENPLDCAFYLASINDSNIEAASVAQTLFEVGRFDDALRAIHFENGNNFRYFWLATSIKKLIEQGNKDEANKYLNKTLEDLKKNDDDFENNFSDLFAPSFIKMGRTEDAFSLIGFSENDPSVAIIVAKAFIEANQFENSNKAISNVYESAEIEQKAEIIELYARLNQKEKAKKLLTEFEPTAFISQSVGNQRNILMPVIRANIFLDNAEHALELWQQYGNVESEYQYFVVINGLLESGEKAKANLYLNQLRSNPDAFNLARNSIVETYLKLNDVESALNTAKSYSSGNDNYWQQKSFLTLADKFIDDKQISAALEILDFAFQRANKIKYVKIPASSSGADPGSRKTIYSRGIFTRFIKLKKFNKVLIVLNSIENKEAKAELTVEFAKQQVKTLPRKKIYDLLDKAQNLFDDEDEKYHPTLTRISSADVYAQLGEKEKAVQLLTKVLEDSADASYYLDKFLLSSAIVFEKNKLKTDAGMKKALRRIIEEAEE